MNGEAKRLAIVATCCFFPTALMGWSVYKSNMDKAISFFRLSIYIFLGILSIAGVFIVIMGGRAIPPMGSFL